ncbi:Y736-like protein [Mya arenaria]|uniref:Y736-like protein n=1 Tax=Mya arenaria TaxID=6604 RepID=A0ABY7F8P4_MYAAR|nr:Y736-like protein [Mya arenaria]
MVPMEAMETKMAEAHISRRHLGSCSRAWAVSWARATSGGGLVFLITWMLFLFLWSSPLLIIEYGTGRYSKKAVLGSFRKFLGDNHMWCGAWVTMVTFCISCFYSVVLGWCFYYFIYYIGHSLPTTEEQARRTFQDYAEGVKTIEKVSLVLVPVLLLVVMFNFVWSLTREFGDKGIEFLFTPHWKSFLEPRVWVDAISQNAFDTGAGMGIMIPYSAYMTRKNGIVKYGHLVPAVNNLVSLLCGITIFSTVFSTLMLSRPTYTQADIVNIMKDSGPASTGLTFIWMPVLFETVGDFGRVLAIMFFLSLSFAGVTSLMSNFELATKTLEDFGLPRRFGMPLTILITFLVGLPSALDIDILTNQDFVWGFALVINGGMLWYMVLRFGVRKFRQKVVNEVIVPIEAIAIVAWWAIDLITNDSGDGENWYAFGRETLVMTLTQWFGLLLLVILVNVIYIIIRDRKQEKVSYYGKETDPLILPSSGNASSRDLDHSLTVSRDLTGSLKELKL